MIIRTRLRLAAVALLSGAALATALVAPAQAHPGPGRHPAPLDRIELPTGFQPEGITVGRGPWAYLGSRANGDIYAANLRTGAGRVISPGLGVGNPSVGLKIDRERLYVAGGPTGTGRVIDVRSGAILKNYQFTDGTSFVNDVVLTRRAAWFTDSAQPQLYVVPRVRHGRPAAKARTVPLTGDWVQGSDPTATVANGITETPDHRALLVVQSNTGHLFRVNKRTGVARRVDLGATLLTAGDGLLLRGRTLYAVRNRFNQVAVVKLDRSGRRGVLLDRLTSPDFDVPATVAFSRGSLYLPNARFTTQPQDDLDFWITRLPLR